MQHILCTANPNTIPLDVCFVPFFLLVQEVNGGVLNVAEGGYARFREDVSMTSVTIMSVTDEGSDISSDRWFGGCIHNSVRTAVHNPI